jgi:hypothetical protein
MQRGQSATRLRERDLDSPEDFGSEGTLEALALALVLESGILYEKKKNMFQW